MFRNYMKIAVRVLLRRKFFTFISLFAVSFTLCILTVCTAILDEAVGPRPPEVRSDRTLCILHARLEGPNYSRTGSAGYAMLDRYSRGLPGVERFSISSLPASQSSYLDGRKIDFHLRRTDGDYWKILDYEFLEGGPLSDEDDARGNKVAVINETTRERFFGGAPALGRTIGVEGREFRVVGVVRDVPILRIVAYSDVWVPTGTALTDGFKQELVGDWLGLILARERTGMAAIRSEFEARLASAQLPDPKLYTKLTAHAEPFFDAVSRDIFGSPEGESHPALLWGIIVGAAVLFMTLPAINLVNINLSRILERASEIGVRKAFGATSATLVGQFVIENVLLTLVGGLLGWIFSGVLLAGINRSGILPYSQLELSWRVLLCGLLTAVFFGILSGVYPAWRMSRMHPVEALRRRPE